MALKGALLILATLLNLPGAVSGDCPSAPFTETSGVISSPGFNTNQSYGNNLTCTYHIKVPENRRVILEFIKLDILGTMPNCPEDSLEILAGCDNTTIGKFCSCSDLTMPNKIYSLDNCMTLIFKSDGSKRAAGFQVQYTSMDNNTELDPSSNCSNMFLSPSNGTFFTPNWPLFYPPDAKCSWTINPTPGKIVRLFFTSFEFEGKYDCQPDRPAGFEDEIRINGTNSTGARVDIVPIVCAMPDDPYTIQQMLAFTVRFASNAADWGNENSGAIAGFATYKLGTLDSQSGSPGCQALPEPTMPPTTTSMPSTTETTKTTLKPSSTASPSKTCSPPWTALKKRCYLVIESTPRRWRDAYAKCVNLASQMVTITSEEENQFIGNIVKVYLKEKKLGQVQVWLGLRKPHVKAQFQWVDGSTLEGYTKWAPEEPNNAHGRELCSEMLVYDKYWLNTWNDVHCGGSAYKTVTVCKKPL